MHNLDNIFCFTSSLCWFFHSSQNGMFCSAVHRTRELGSAGVVLREPRTRCPIRMTYRTYCTYYGWKNSGKSLKMGTSLLQGLSLNNILLVVSGISEASAVGNAIGGIDIQLWNCQAADRTAKLSWLIRSWYNRSHYVLSYWSCSVSHWLEFFGKTAHHDNCWIVMNYSHWCIDANTTLDWIRSHLHVINSASDHHISNCPKAVGNPFSVRTQRGWQQDLRSQKTLTLMSEAKHMDKHISKKVQKWIQSQDANVIQSQCQLCQGSSFRLSFILVTSTSLAPWASQQSVGVSQCDLHLPNLCHAVSDAPMAIALKKFYGLHWYLIDGNSQVEKPWIRSGNKNQWNWNFKNMPVLDTIERMSRNARQN